MNFLNQILIKLIDYYQYSISLDHKAGAVGFCKFTPSCSEYSKQCFQKYHFLKAILKSCKRIIKCNPCHKGGLDLP